MFKYVGAIEVLLLLHHAYQTYHYTLNACAGGHVEDECILRESKCACVLVEVLTQELWTHIPNTFQILKPRTN